MGIKNVEYGNDGTRAEPKGVITSELHLGGDEVVGVEVSRARRDDGTAQKLHFRATIVERPVEKEKAAPVAVDPVLREGNGQGAGGVFRRKSAPTANRCRQIKPLALLISQWPRHCAIFADAGDQATLVRYHGLLALSLRDRVTERSMTRWAWATQNLEPREIKWHGYATPTSSMGL